jgi:hypothetical protein
MIIERPPIYTIYESLLQKLKLLCLHNAALQHPVALQFGQNMYCVLVCIYVCVNILNKVKKKKKKKRDLHTDGTII